MNEGILDKINLKYELFQRQDKAIERLNRIKKKNLKQIIELLKQTDLLKSIKDIEEVRSAQFNIYRDIENPNWTELEIRIQCKKKSEKFDVYRDYLDYEDNIRTHIYKILDDNPKLSDFIMVYIER